MTSHLQSLIVNSHNKLRNNVALGLETRGINGSLPYASNMLALTWDAELATIAQRWADVCMSMKSENAYDSCRKTDRFDVGQNVYSIISNDTLYPNFVAIILDWYYEVIHFDNSNLNNFTSFSAKTFTQIIWAQTKYIGCGHSSFVEEINGVMSVVHRFVCNYGPSGNVVGQSVFLEGTPCSNCAKDDICDFHYPGLCTEKESVDTENRLREVLNTITDLIKPEMNYNIKSPKINKIDEVAKRNNIETNAILEYLVKAIDYHKNLNETTTEVLLKESDEVFVDLKNINGKPLNKPIIAELRHEMDPSIKSNGLIVKESDYKTVDGIWKDGSCRCDHVFRSSASSLKLNITFFFLLLYRFIIFTNE